MGKNYDVIIFFQNTFILRISRIGNFANIIKTIFKKSKKLKELEICQYLSFVVQSLISGEKMPMSAELKWTYFSITNMYTTKEQKK